MLLWIEQADGWHAEGFRIHLAAPFRWLLFEVDNEAPGSVLYERKPLAVGHSLTECKREAELLHAKRRRRHIQRREIITLLLVLSCAPLLIGYSANSNGVVVLSALAIGVRSVAVLLGSLLPQTLGERHELFYQ